MLRFATLMLLILAPSAAAEAQSLEEVLARIYGESPTLEAARARLRAVDEEVAIAQAGYRPKLTSRSEAGLAQIDSSDGGSTLTTAAQSLDLDQTVLSGGALPAGERVAHELVLAERAVLVATEQAVLFEGVEAYSAMLRDRTVLEIARRNESRLEAQLDATRQSYRFGGVTRTDVAQAETRYARAIADRIRAEGELAAAEAEFARVAGFVPDAPQPVAVPALLPASLEEALEDGPEHPLIAAAEHGLDGARASVDRSLAALNPKLSLAGRASYAHEPTRELQWRSDLSISAIVSVPLYEGGGDRARIRQSKQVVAEKRYALDDARREVERDITVAWQDFVAARARQRSVTMQERAAELALDGIRSEAVVGARSVLDVLDAEQESFEAQVDAARAEHEVVVGAYRLRAATGTLTAQVLTLPIEAYDPVVHYRDVSGKWFGLGPDPPALTER